MKKRIEVVGAILTRGDAVFAARRGPGMTLEGYWEFPGGKIGAGETPQLALAREMREELNCEVEVGEFVTATEHEYDFGIVVLSTYRCTLKGSDPELSEHSEIRWVPVSELSVLSWAPADVPAVEIIQGDNRP
ncbi:(deoxy)nucleoside triphosphate pyrophosphohydrolase [Rothia sp. HC945]|uniref:(deoxy)nucleoside triphosphate pyrophosphohydrolase n=1 Tax=Rothia sp. HC945 TaxID=3171170 RepID=UPI00264F8361|nr:(deoxy)nucleoside triphosphate pyrophosphohydrolase [Kocuria sp.]MDN5617006.1 (deoxy)nucleoside triphosphate pyrophosphohydrolase [Kocuria sp.]